MDVLPLLRDEISKTAVLVKDVSPDQLALSTPCAGFDVRALLNHLCLGAEYISRAAQGDDKPPEYERDFVGEDPGAAFDHWSGEMLSVLSAPGTAERTVHLPGMVAPGAVLFVLALMDTVVHRWDLARAIGADPRIDERIAATLLEQLTPLMSDELRAASPDAVTASIPFGPLVEVPEAASAVDRLVGFLGRTP